MRVVGHFFEQARGFQIGHDSFARFKTVETRVRPSCGAHFRVVGHHVDFGQVVAASDFEIVRIVRGSYFHRAGAEFAIHDKIVNYRNLAIYQRQQNHFSEEMPDSAHR